VQRSLRDDRWKLIRYPQVNQSQLFDLQNDPHELNNLAGQPAHAAKVAELKARLAATQQELGDPCALTSANPAPAAWSPEMAKSASPSKPK
jgi:arylsulfatase A-like enzyme